MSLRLFFASLLLLAVGAGAYVFLGPRLADPEGQAAKARAAAYEAEIRKGLVSQAEALELPKVSSAVAGHEVTPKIWDFRGTTQLTEETKGSVYGRMMLHCEETFDRPECWTVTFLKVDGRPVISLDDEQLAAAAAEAETVLASAQAELKTAQASARQTIAAGDPQQPVAAMSIAPEAAADPMKGAETGDAAAAQEAPQEAAEEATQEAVEAVEEVLEAVEETAAEPAAAEAPAPAFEEEAAAIESVETVEEPIETSVIFEAEEAANAVVAAAIAEGDLGSPIATHEINATDVNARAEPGRDADIVTVLDIGQTLVRLGGQDEWGHYQILGGPNDGEQVWVFNRLVKTRR